MVSPISQQYIFSQIIGAFFAALVVYASYKQELTAITAEMIAAGSESAAKIYSQEGPAGIFALYVGQGQSLGYVFFTELLTTTLLGLLVFTVLDLSNPFISFVTAPALIGLGYAV